MKQRVKGTISLVCAYACVCVCTHIYYVKFIQLQLQYFGRVYYDLFSFQIFQHPFLYKAS